MISLARAIIMGKTTRELCTLRNYIFIVCAIFPSRCAISLIRVPANTKEVLPARRSVIVCKDLVRALAQCVVAGA